MSASRNENVLVLGLGNTLLSDDGVGVHIVRRLTADAATPLWLHAVDGGTLGFRLTGFLNGAGGVLIIDAADIAAPAGTIRLLDDKLLSERLANGKTTSAHEAGLAALLCLARLESLTLRHLAVLAIQPQIIDWGERLSDAVENAVAPACDMIKSIVTKWRCAE
jgi:hydrogenase maturation protease